VLLIDDDVASRDAVETNLAHRGISVIAASEGRAALRLLWQAPPPCLIVLDLQMPHMDGWKFRAAQAADAAIARIPVVIMTGHGGDLAEDRAVRLGVHAFLRKPVDADALASLVERACLR
jgi:CheY-like chemotaxis protein